MCSDGAVFGSCETGGQISGSKKPRSSVLINVWSDLIFIFQMLNKKLTKHLTKQAGIQHVPDADQWPLCVSPCTCPPVWRAGSGRGRWTAGHTRSSPRHDTGCPRWCGPHSSCRCRTNRGRRAWAACWTLGCWWNPGWLSGPRTEPGAARGASSEGPWPDLHHVCTQENNLSNFAVLCTEVTYYTTNQYCVTIFSVLNRAIMRINSYWKANKWHQIFWAAMVVLYT